MRMLEAIISARQNRPEQRQGIQTAVMPEFPACAEKRNNGTGLFHHEDFVLLADETRAWIVQIEDISLLEACRNVTLVHLPEDKLVIRRSLQDCERRLNSSLFFRASRGYVVNLSHVKQPRLLKDERLMFLLKNGKEVVFSRRQSVLFRKRCGL
jgi:two-component system, LytTR family, response regulator